MKAGLVFAVSFLLSGCSSTAIELPPALAPGKSALRTLDRRFDGIVIAHVDLRAERYPVMKSLSQGYVSIDSGRHEIDVMCSNDDSTGIGMLIADLQAGRYYHVSGEKRPGFADIWLVDSLSDEVVARVRVEKFTPNVR